MEKLIPFITEIHDILYQSNLTNVLEVPYIVVIGAQSTGKSSVLESIIGRDFLPRGKGIVTRRPIEIQLVNIKDRGGDQREYVEFLEKPSERIYNLGEVKAFIDNSTEHVCGKQKVISNVPIKLKFFSPNVVDLMLVDLPGITKNPVGDQPKDIERLIIDLINPYIKNPNSLILAVSKANDDLANSEGLKLAREVDQQGNRTLGVITQLDIMDEGCDVLNDVMNRTYPLKLGYVGVVCRGHKDVEQLKDLSQQVQDEKAFFENHKQYSKVVDKMGVPYLVRTLNVSFIQHIKKGLPKIRENIIEQILLKEQEMKQYGEIDINQDKSSKGLYILKLISQFTSAFSEMIRGKYIKTLNEELLGGARINYILFDIFRNSLNGMDPFDIIKDDDIRTAIKNANGLKSSLFVPEVAFENLVRQQLMRLQNPCLECSQYVYEELRRILYTINIPDIERFENLRNSIFNVMEDVLNKCLAPTNFMIKNLIEIEMGFINVNHPDFVGGTNALLGLVNDGPEQQQSDFEQNMKNERAHDKKQIKDKKEDKKDDKKEENYGFGNFLGRLNPFKEVNKQAMNYESKLQLMSKNKLGDSVQMSEAEIDGHSSYKNFQNGSYLIDKYYNSNMPIQNMPSVPGSITVRAKASKRELTEIEMIKKLIVSYFNVVKKNVNDSVPKTVITMLVNQSKNICERELISALYQTDKLDWLFEENAFIVECREQGAKTLRQLKNCLNILNNIDAKFY